MNNDAVITCPRTEFSSTSINYIYDYLGRLVEKNISNNSPIRYNYITNGKRTSSLVKSIDINGDIYSYKYDKLNNITHIYHNGILENRYDYDDYNELVKEDNYILNKRVEYTYDSLGNILFKKAYELGTDNLVAQDRYQYNNSNWQDQLTQFNNDVITYDTIGNPLTIGENITLDWMNGRQLNQYVDSNNTVEYQYNKDGIRTSKTINNVKIEYYVEGTSIIFEKTGNDVLYYIRNEVDGLIGFKYNDETYYYITNAQNDIIGILNSSNNIVAKYTYDAWGNIISITDSEGNDVSNDNTHIGNINPFRYRSYYYDKETNLYYLNIRYYNPVWGRFINVDGIIGANKDINSCNLYAYCSNNVIKYVDITGNGLFTPLAKLGWKLVSAALKKVGMPVSGELLENATKKVDTVMYFGDNFISNKIKKDTDFKNKINEIVTETNTGFIDKNETMEFNASTDLKGSFHGAKIKASGNVENGCGTLDITIHDKYDFKFEPGYFNDGIRGFVFTVGNNMAWTDQYLGSIHTYDVYVVFKYDPCS